MNKLLVLPDIHGRKFWKKPCENVDSFDKVIFLGDYLDPYDFEKISVKDAIENFKEIIEFKKNNMEKVVLLIGNHDCPYYSDIYFSFSSWHCRHSALHHKEIHKLFEDNFDLFQIAYVYEDILFTHAGVDSEWLEKTVGCEEKDINGICSVLNGLTNTKDGLLKLYKITPQRGGRDKYGSCIWSDVHDMMQDVIGLSSFNYIDSPIYKYKQIFGHTIQAYYTLEGTIAFGEAIEFDNCKMLDTSKAYILDSEKFNIEVFTNNNK